MDGGSGDDNGWRAYERPDVPEPESTRSSPDWQVYGDRGARGAGVSCSTAR